jgi:hypothetical protein
VPDEYNPPFSHRPKRGDKFPIEVPPSDKVLDKILSAIGDFFAGIGRGIKHLFSSHYCELKNFNVTEPLTVPIQVPAGVAPARGKQFKVTAEFASNGAECGCCEYRQFVRGSCINQMGGIDNFQTAGGNLDETKFREDGYPSVGGFIPRGHRDRPETSVDRYLPDQKTGCKYESIDEPQCGLDQMLHLEFLGMIVDTCEHRIVELQTWRVGHPMSDAQFSKNVNRYRLRQAPTGPCQRSLSVAACVLIAVFVGSAASESANAQTTYCWINAKTGVSVPVSQLLPQGTTRDPLEPNRATAKGLRGTYTYIRNPDGSWTNAANGAPAPPLYPETAEPDPLNPNRATAIGLLDTYTYVRVSCPPAQTASSSGLYLGGELVKNWGWVRSTERLAATDVVTNQFSDRADPFGGGLIVGYKFAPWANNIVVSPFASFDFLHAPVNHAFPSGSFLGTTGNFMGTAGVKVGPQLDMGLWLYGIAGVSVLNETLNINFIPVASSTSATVPGATVGLGGAWQPSFLQGFGRPVSLFLEYQHTWWQSANFNTPAASPPFNYNFARQDDVVKFGFTVPLSAPPPAPAPIYPVKAPMLK